MHQSPPTRARPPPAHRLAHSPVLPGGRVPRSLSQSTRLLVHGVLHLLHRATRERRRASAVHHEDPGCHRLSHVRQLFGTIPRGFSSAMAHPMTAMPAPYHPTRATCDVLCLATMLLGGADWLLAIRCYFQFDMDPSHVCITPTCALSALLSARAD